MGFSIKFNWVLQIDFEIELVPGSSYNFSKDGNRVFPLQTPIDLIDSSRSAIAKIRIMSFKNLLNKTTGEFQVIKIYSGNEKEVLTNYWIENEK
ncbi:DUF2584 family protein [Gynuella sunshinyii]|nr:DUF2584 family protein [Gynuella sunshinyii]